MSNDAAPGAKMRLGMRVKLCRIGHGLRLRDVEAKTGIDRTTLSRIENGRLYIAGADLVALCQVLNVSPNMLLCGSENWNPSEVRL